MHKVLQILLIILLIPVFLVVFTVIHELGHTILARLLGDPNSVFYLVKIEADSACLGCNIYDQGKLSWGANLFVSLGGLLATQFVALAALFCCNCAMSIFCGNGYSVQLPWVLRSWMCLCRLFKVYSTILIDTLGRPMLI
jgi:hypothetical protein